MLDLMIQCAQRPTDTPLKACQVMACAIVLCLLPDKIDLMDWGQPVDQVDGLTDRWGNELGDYVPMDTPEPRFGAGYQIDAGILDYMDDAIDHTGGHYEI